MTAGEYEVELHYTCPERDIGSTIELSFGDQKVTAQVTIAHDPPLVGAAQDRFVRNESLVKDFRIFKMGKINLPKGKGRLSLRALEIPGLQVMDVRLLNLRK